VRHPFALGALAAAGALLLAGCGSSGKSTTSAASTAASTATQTPAAATGTSSTETPSGAVIVRTKQGRYGTILAGGPKQLTVYMFEADRGSTSSCTGECAKDWPPVTTSGQPQTAGGAVAADLGTSTRPDGTTQVTYKGHPLYYFEQDTDSGDAYGQGSKAFGAEWYVLAPSGNKVEEGDDSAGSSGKSSSSGDGAADSSNSGNSSGASGGSPSMGSGGY
jgi:predicted lipoprotein with Yx(FWY)xxD motif